MVKVSVIMPVYNGEDFLVNTLKNLSKQTLDDFELICINDGSSDNSLDLLNNLAKKYSFIKILNQDNQGSGQARNRGIDAAQGEYIAFLDADDIFLDESALEKMYDLGTQYDADMVAGNLFEVDSKGDVIGNPNYKKNNYEQFFNIENILPEDYGVPFAFYKNIFRRDFINKYNIRFPDLKRGQDPVFLSKILINLDFILAVPVSFYGYYANAGEKAADKVNTFEKKYDYMTNYKECFKILNSNVKFNSSLKKYAETLFSFLIYKKDKELFEIVHDLFEDGKETYFGNVFFELLYLKLSLLDLFNQDFFNDYHVDFERDLTYNSLKGHIPEDILGKYSEIMLKYSNKDDLVVVSKDLFNVTLPNIIDKRLKILNDVISSNSWRITTPLRKLKHIIKN